MDCKQFLDNLDSDAFGPRSAEMQAHLADCTDCRRAAASRDEMIELLGALPEPAVPADLADRVFDFVPRASEPKRRHTGWALALAASLLIGIGIGITVQWASLAPNGNYQVRNGTILVPADTVTPVRIALDSARPLQHVAFIVNVPAGMQLRGHPGEQQVAWNGTLAQGRNVLNLELVARPGATGILETDLQYADHSSAYKVRVVAADSTSFRNVIHSLLARMKLV